MNSILIKNIDRIFRQYRLIMKMDFNSDIDMVRSSGFEVNNETQSLKFLMDKSDYVFKNGYRKIFGGINEIDSKYNLIHSVNEEFEDASLASCSVFNNKCFDRDKESMIFIKFKRLPKSYFYFRLCNANIYRVMRKILDDKSPYNKDAFSDNSNVSLDFIFSDDGLKVDKRVGSLLQHDYVLVVLEDFTEVELLVDLRHYLVLVNGRKYRLPKLSPMYDSELYINIMSLIDEGLIGKETACIYELSYGKSEGYIYFKDIFLDGKTAKVFAVYNGNPEFQYFSDKEKNWVKILKDQSLEIDKILRLRIKMDTEDCVHQIMIMEPI